MEQTAFVGYN